MGGRLVEFEEDVMDIDGDPSRVVVFVPVELVVCTALGEEGTGCDWLVACASVNDL